MQERGLTLNPRKCIFGQTSLTYLGYRFTSEGVTIDPDKRSDIQNASPPTNPTEVRSFLGLANYCARFVPNFATITAPLRKLTEKNTDWEWSAEHQTSFLRIKQILLSDQVMAYFNPAKATEVLVDESPVGVSAILTQRSHDKVHIISYASRALSSTEQRYSRLEREALAVLFGCERHHLYQYGSQFSVLTDHRPLVPMFTNPHAARMERWALRLQQYHMTLHYRPGKDHPADYASRHPASILTTSRAEKVAEEYINFIISQTTPAALDRITIRQKTSEDGELQAVMTAVSSGKWDTSPNSFRMISTELSVPQDSLLLTGGRIVLPASLRCAAVNLAHKGHQGLVKTKQLLRSRVWFPGIDALVDEVMKGCLSCQANTMTHHREPLQMTEMPDFNGPLPTGEHLLAIIDEHCRFPIVETVRSLTASAITHIFDKIFSTFRIPKQLKTDNGPPFNSQQFTTFTQVLRFKHHRVTPLWPEANGEAERFMMLDKT